MNNTQDQNVAARNQGIHGLYPSDEISLLQMLTILQRHKWVAAATLAVFIVASVTYAFTATPKYRAQTILAPAGGSSAGLGSIISQFGGALGSVAGMLGGMGGTRGARLARGEAITALTSTAHIQSFINSKNLLPVLFANKWNAEESKWMTEGDDTPTIFEGYKLFKNEILEVDEDPLTGIITFAIEWKDPAMAADWANELVSSLNSRLRENAIRDADRTVDFLNQELERTKVVELRQALFFMIEQQIGSKTSARVQEEFAFKVIDPAIVPDMDEFVFPNRLVIIAAGLIAGVFFGLLAAFLVNAINKPLN